MSWTDKPMTRTMATTRFVWPSLIAEKRFRPIPGQPNKNSTTIKVVREKRKEIARADKKGMARLRKA
jgi:hypothetical protein